METRENMLKNFIEENKNLKETIKNLQKTNISSSNQLLVDKNSAFSPQFTKSKTLFHTETAANSNLTTQSPLFKLSSIEFIKQGLLKSNTLKDQIKKSKGSVSKGVFTTSRNFIKSRNSSNFL